MRLTNIYLNNTIRNGSFTKAIPLKPPWKVLFFGTDNFSVASLEALNKEYSRNSELINKLEIVTNVKRNPIHKYGLKNHLKIHSWPLSLPQEQFHLGLVVSFGHLIPKYVIDYFPMGMLNVHASLLPRWRGAAPIIYALANGDTKTGVSIMRIRPDKFDVGEVLAQEEVEISGEMKMPELHDKLAHLGGQCLIKVMKELPDVLERAKEQPVDGVTYAPKVMPSFAVINFSTQSCKTIYDLCRALHGFMPLNAKWQDSIIKIVNVPKYEQTSPLFPPGTIEYDKPSKLLKISCIDGFIYVDQIGVPNKKVMSAVDFNNGFVKKQLLDHRILR